MFCIISKIYKSRTTNYMKVNFDFHNFDFHDFDFHNFDSKCIFLIN